MIILSIETNNNTSEQFEKITEEYLELKEKIEIAESKQQLEYFQNDVDEIVSEAFDVAQSANQLIIDLIGDENFIKMYKKHLGKLQSRINDGLIKVDQYIDA